MHVELYVEVRCAPRPAPRMSRDAASWGLTSAVLAGVSDKDEMTETLAGEADTVVMWHRVACAAAPRRGR